MWIHLKSAELPNLEIMNFYLMGWQYFPVNFGRLLRTNFLQTTSGRVRMDYIGYI